MAATAEPPAGALPSPAASAPVPTPATELEAETCDCCGLTEDCTPAYAARVRARHGGRWVCGLCADAIADELTRGGGDDTNVDEVLARHADLCRAPRSGPPSPAGNADHLIAAVRHLLLRRCRLRDGQLSPATAPRAVRSTPCSPRHDTISSQSSDAGSLAVDGAGTGALARSGSCFPDIGDSDGKDS